jgi:nitrite reductase (cytochrome c-552)
MGTSMRRRDRMAPTVRLQRRTPWFTLLFVTALVGGGIWALLNNVFERKQERRQTYVSLVTLTEETTDPALWGRNWPLQYDSYKQTVEKTRTRFAGHGGSETMPDEKFARDPWLKRMFAGYAFALDYRDRRGHAFMLADQEQTERVRKRSQPGACLHCHASIIPTYRKAGAGDVMRGFETVNMMTYADAHALLESEGAHPVSCVDCHDPTSMQLRVTRPGFIESIAALASSDAALPHLPSIERWRRGARDQPFDPNQDATRQELRSFVCGQCHVEYYFKGDRKQLIYPWQSGLKVEQIESYYDAEAWSDFSHAETGAPILKAQHPEFELWSQGIHARAGVACADCHMPYQRVGASKVSDHWVRSPLLSVNRACQVCHKVDEAELLARVDVIQDRNHELMQRAAVALIDMLDGILTAKAAGATAAELSQALALQRKAQWRLDFVAAENSMGFHAPQEAARILAEATDYARQSQVQAQRTQLGRATKLASAPTSAH